MKPLNFLIFASLLLSAALPARAEDLGCLQRTKGKVVLWDKDWQADRSDGNVRYLVRDYREQMKKGEPKQYILTLAAQGPARKPERVATIVKDLGAHFFCQRIEGGLADKGKGVLMALGGRDAARGQSYELAAFYPAFEINPSDLPFRRWVSAKGWVPAALPEERLFICYTPKGPVGCVGHDYELSKAGTPKRQHVRLELPGPFLRHFPTGWAEDLPLGELDDAEIVSCPILGRTYFCIASEKEKFAGELRALEQEIKIREERFPTRAIVPSKVASTKQMK